MQRAILIVAMLLIASSALGQDALRVLPETVDGCPTNELMKEYLLGQIWDAWEDWKAAYEERTTPEAIAEYQQRMHDLFMELIGGLPERTPLNPQLVGTIERGGYRVEKILFESQPRFYVSAALFLPDASRHAPPYPGVLVPCGHAKPAKAHEEYQSVGALLALNGMAALVYDPIDQGERMQLIHPDGSYDSWGTNAHTLVGGPSILLGRNTATFEIWDGMRGIDYLQSRPEVDPERIGITGNSGGGTQSSYLMALDDRIKCAAVSCYLHYQAVQLRKAPGDAEQNIYGQMTQQLDHPDFIMMKAPRPVLICAATEDFFDINATWETFRLAKRFYTRLGFPERVDLLENPAKHNYNKTQREGAVRWLARWLLGRDEPIVEPELELIDEKDLWCAPGGQVMLIDGARSTYDINREYADKLAKQRRAKGAPADMLKVVRALTACHRLAELSEPAVESSTAGNLKTFVIKPEGGIVLPAVLFNADKPASETVLFVSEHGKQGGKELAKDGARVFAVDLRGVGETAPVGESYKGPGLGDWVNYFRAYVLGRSYVGMWAEDILVCARYLKDDGAKVRLVSEGNTGVAALHAAAFEPDLFESVELRGCIQSWDGVISARPPMNQLVNAVHGALEHYDLPDLAATLGDKLTVTDPVDAQGTPLALRKWQPWSDKGKPEYAVKRAPAPPALNGDWDGEVWQAANEFQVRKLKAPAGFFPETRGRVLYDDKGLYVTFRVNDRYVRSIATEYHGDVWEDACAEFFVQPKPERGYFNFEINCGGTMLLSYHENPAFKGKPERKDGAVPWEIARQVDIYHSMPEKVDPEIAEDTTWIIEYFIPFSLLEAYVGPIGDLAGQTWRANFYKCAETNSHPHWGAWSAIQPGYDFHSPKFFGQLNFK